jgi:hypothetical protein
MIITITNPLNNEQVEIDAAITTNLLTTPEGSIILSVSAIGSVDVTPAEV